MPARPIFVATHPRACSTAFERVFMTRRDVLQCAHEPFGDAFYYGPERLSERFSEDEAGREASGFAKTTYQDVMSRLDRDGAEVSSFPTSTTGKRVFIKDIAHYLLPPDGKPAQIAPSLKYAQANETNGVHANGVNGDAPKKLVNPTVVPDEILREFDWAFLIRHPRRSIPSYYRCTVPPLDEITGFYNFMPSEAGYDEVRRLFDYLKDKHFIGPAKAGEPDAEKQQRIPITVIDADDLLDKPYEAIEAFCKATGLDYSPRMLNWENEEDQKYAVETFEKWKGFHEDAIDSSRLKPRTHAHKTSTVESENAEWREKFGEEAAKVIRETVDKNIPDYEYLKTFALKF